MLVSCYCIFSKDLETRQELKLCNVFLRNRYKQTWNLPFFRLNSGESCLKSPEVRRNSPEVRRFQANSPESVLKSGENVKKFRQKRGMFRLNSGKSCLNSGESCLNSGESCLNSGENKKKVPPRPHDVTLTDERSCFIKVTEGT